MIARLSGTLAAKTPTQAIIDTQGVGYEVWISLATYQRLPEVGGAITLMVHTHVREDELVLFGFLDAREKQLFKKLLKVSGLGPRLAINILSGISATDLIAALASEDIFRLTTIPGVGKKTAERMVIELKDKIVELAAADQATREPAPASLFQEDLLSVLVNLGYKRSMAERALRKVPLARDTTLEEAVRLTLRHLGEQQHGPRAGV